MGYIYRPRYTDRHGQTKESSVYWVQYYANGKPVRESTHEESVKLAEKFLKKKEGHVADGKPVAVNADRIKFAVLAQMVVDDYTINHKKTLRDVENRLRLHILPVFGHRRAMAITPTDIKQYVVKRLAEERTLQNGDIKRPTNASVNRELSIVRRAFKIAIKDGVLHAMPAVTMLEENNIRKGFFEREQFDAVLSKLTSKRRDAVQAVSEFANITGWRKSECLRLEWDGGVDFNAGLIRIDDTKNGEAREFPMTDDLRTLLENQWAKRCEIQQRTGVVDARVFIFLHGKRAGQRIKSFRRSWEAACREAGLPNRLFHDFRRTAVRRSIRTPSINQKLAMTLSGHKTISVFDRYNIISGADITAAGEALNAAARADKVTKADKDTDKDSISASDGTLQVHDPMNTRP